MTPRARRVLQELATDELCDLLCDGIEAYCGPRRTTSRIVSELVWCSAVRSVVPSNVPGAKYYAISDMGRAYLRRPELEAEYLTAVMRGIGAFTIEKDRIVPLDAARAGKDRE